MNKLFTRWWNQCNDAIFGQIVTAGGVGGVLVALGNVLGLYDAPFFDIPDHEYQEIAILLMGFFIGLLVSFVLALCLICSTNYQTDEEETE